MHTFLTALAAAIQSLARATHEAQAPGTPWTDTTRIKAYLDDIYILIPTSLAPAVMEIVRQLADRYNLKLNVPKTEMSTNGVPHPHFPCYYTDRFSILGSAPTAVRASREEEDDEDDQVRGAPLTSPDTESPS